MRSSSSTTIAWTAPWSWRASLGLEVHRHPRNRGYGANQKTCYRLALELGADIVVMLHPDYQYSPRLIPPLAAMVASGEYDLVLGSRIVGGGGLPGGSRATSTWPTAPSPWSRTCFSRRGRRACELLR